MSTTYIIGTLGQGGCSINFAGGELFEQIGEGGEYTSKRAATADAAELARAWARDKESGESDVAIAVDKGNGGLMDLVTVASAKVGHKTVSWS